MQYLYKVDDAPDRMVRDRTVQALLQRAEGATPYVVASVRTPAGGGSSEGLHTHAFEQVFYLLSGQMNVEIDGEQHQAEPGTLILFPAGALHRNWNAGQTETVHLVFNLG